MEEWKEYKATEFCQTVTDGTHDSPKPKDKGHYLITSKHLKDSGIDFNSANYISEEDYIKVIARSKVEQYDILFSMIGTIGNIVQVKEEDVDFAVKNIGIFKMGKNLLKSSWLFYWLKSPFAHEYVSQRLAGSTQSYLTLSTLREFPVFYPGDSKANKIVAVLKSLDDKIDCNRRINDNLPWALWMTHLILLLFKRKNDNLEQQVSELYKSWKNGVKDNAHSYIRLDPIASFISGYSYKGTELVPSKKAMATIKNFCRNGGFKMDGYKEIEPSGKIKPEQYAEMFDVLVAHTDITQNADVIGNAEMVLSLGGYEGVIFSMDLVKVEPKSVFPYRFLLATILRDTDFKSYCMGYVNGTTVLHLSKKALPNYTIAIPDDKGTVACFDNCLSKVYGKMAEIISENTRLAQLRDTLLPRLMSGELKVNEIEKSITI